MLANVFGTDNRDKADLNDNGTVEVRPPVIEDEVLFLKQCSTVCSVSRNILSLEIDLNSLIIPWQPLSFPRLRSLENFRFFF